MTILEYYKKGIVKDLFVKGVVTIQAYEKFQMYSVYEQYKNLHGKPEAVKLTAIDFDCSYSTVYRAINFIQS